MGAGDEVFVGREVELAELDAALRPELPRTGRPTVVLVAGEAGIGKSRLVTEALTRTPLTAVWGACWDGDGAPAFWPWAQVIRACLALPAGERWRHEDPGAGEVLALLPEAGASTLPTESSRFRLFESVTRLVTSTAGDGLVVALDDLQWGDDASLRLLAFLVRAARDERIVVLGTYRDDEVGPDHPLAAVMAELAGDIRHVPLRGLGPDALAVLAPDVDELHRTTGGNPFFVREVMALMRTGSRRRVPAGVRAVIEQRLARLSMPCVDALQAAAVIGQSFALDDVAAVLDRPLHDVVVALDEALDAQLVLGDGGPSRFAHDLLRETTYATIGASLRRDLHARAGARAAGAAEQAYHLLAAVPVVEPARAAEAAMRAGDRALAVLAFEEAGDWYERALQLASDPVAVIAGLLALGEARLRSGDLPRARTSYVDAASVARDTGRTDDLARAAMGLGAGLGGFEVGLFDDVQIELLEEALQAIDERDSPLRVQLLARLSVALSFVADDDRRLALSESAVAMARRIHDRSALGYALAAYCDAVSGPAFSEARRDAAAEIVDLALDLGDLRLELLGRRLLLVALLELGDIAEVDVHIRAFARGADVLREPLYRWYVPLWHGMRALMAGRTEESAAWCEEATTLGALAHSGNARMLTPTQEWVRLRVEGRLPEAADTFARGVSDLFEGLPGTSVLWALSALHVGDTDRARVLLRELLRDVERLPNDSEWLPTMAQIAELVAAVGDHASLELVDRLMAPFDERVVVEGIGAAVYGTLGGFRAIVLARLGRDEEARRLTARAAEVADAIGLRAMPRLAVEAPHAPPPAVAERAGTLARDGDVWALTFDDLTVRVRDAKGMRDLATLLARVGAPVHVSELVVSDPDGRAAVSSTGAPVLDRRAVAEYRRRLADLDDDLAEAERHHDDGRVAKLQVERDFLVAELSGGLGLGGRARRASDDVDRARKAVRARLRDAIGRVEAAHPALGRHLTHAVHTGTFCSYDPEAPVRWTVEF